MKNILKKIGIFLLVIMIISTNLLMLSYAKVSPSNKKTQTTDKINNASNITNMNNFVSEINGTISQESTSSEITNSIPKEVLMYNSLEESFLKEKNCYSLQNFVDKFLTQYAGDGAEWYFIAIYKMHGNELNYDSYKNALNEYLNKGNRMSPVTRQLIGLVYLLLDKNNIFLEDLCDNTIGKYGIMSYIYGLHLLNNGCKSSSWTKEKVIKYLLDEYNFQTGYSFMGNESDVDVISMAVQALAPFYNTNNEVKKMIDNSLDIISRVQNEEGGFINQNMSNSESISQVILVCSILGIDVESDQRFIKNGNNLYMALEKFKTADGLYGHNDNTMKDPYAITQAFYSLASMASVKQGKDSLFKIYY